MIRNRLLIAACLSLMPLAACGPTVQERCTGAKDMPTCMAAAQSGGDMKDMLIGGAASAALATAMARPSAPPVIVHHAAPVSYHYQRSYSPYRAPMRTRTVTTVRTTPFGGRSFTSTTTSYRPSFRSRR